MVSAVIIEIDALADMPAYSCDAKDIRRLSANAASFWFSRQLTRILESMLEFELVSHLCHAKKQYWTVFALILSFIYSRVSLVLAQF